jgi:hypothetical protein
MSPRSMLQGLTLALFGLSVSPVSAQVQLGPVLTVSPTWSPPGGVVQISLPPTVGSFTPNGRYEIGFVPSSRFFQTPVYGGTYMRASSYQVVNAQLMNVTVPPIGSNALFPFGEYVISMALGFQRAYTRNRLTVSLTPPSPPATISLGNNPPPSRGSIPVNLPKSAPPNPYTVGQTIPPPNHSLTPVAGFSGPTLDLTPRAGPRGSKVYLSFPSGGQMGFGSYNGYLVRFVPLADVNQWGDRAIAAWGMPANWKLITPYLMEVETPPLLPTGFYIISVRFTTAFPAYTKNFYKVTN